MMMKVSLFFLCFLSLGYTDNWPQASGKYLNYQIEANAPTHWDLTKNENVLWRTTLPEGGQSTPIVYGNKVFLTMNKPVHEDITTNKSIIAMCYDANDGTLIWKRELNGHWSMRMNAIFSDATVFSPVTNGKTVLFSSPSGIVTAFDFDGNEKWSYHWEESGGYNIRQHEPFLIDEKIFITVERNDAFTKPDAKVGHKYWGRRKFIRCFNINDGKVIWDAECDTSSLYTSMPALTHDKQYAILTARGGAHKPPEKEPGLSLINTLDGKSIFDISYKMSDLQNLIWDDKNIYLFGRNDMDIMDSRNGTVLKKITFKQPSPVTKYNEGYETNLEKVVSKKIITAYTNIQKDNYIFFMSAKPGYLARLNLTTEKTEYLQVPFEIKDGVSNYKTHTRPEVRNSRGYLVKGDVRSSNHGWGHLGAIPPVIIGSHIYFTTMIGTVYVLKWNAAVWNEKAIISINNLGPVGKTWTLAGFAYANGKFYTRTLKELICIANK